MPLASPFAFPVFFEAYIGEKSLYGLFYGCKDRVGLCQTEAQAKQLFRAKGGINVLIGESLDLIYQITDHLGSVRAIRRGNGTVERRFDYYPFGSESRHWAWSGQLPFPKTQAGGDAIPKGGGFDFDFEPIILGARAATSRWRFGGKEIAGQKVGASAVLSAPAGTPAAAAGRPYLDFGARLYDPRTAAWLSQDPMAEKYYPISPYTYCTGNPVNLVDYLGTSIDSFVFNQAGLFIQQIIDDHEDRILVMMNNGDVIEGSFVDLINDPRSVNINTKLVLISNDDISKFLTDAGVYNPENQGFEKALAY